MTEDTVGLPLGWTRKRVGDVLKLRNGYAFKPTEWTSTGRPIIRIQNLKSKSATFNHYDGELPGHFKAKPGDLLFAWSGTPGTSFGAHVWEGPEAWINQHIFRVGFSTSEFDRDFLRLALNYNLADYIAQAQGGVGLAHITKAKLDDSLLIAPPVHVQHAIAELVSEHETLRTSAAIHLRRCAQLIQRFRQTVLVAACSGRLTADWRDAHPDVPTVTQALAILNSSKRRRTRKDSGTDLDLPDFPDSYVVTTIADAAELIEYGTSRRADASADVGVPVLRMGNIQDGRLELADLKFRKLDSEIEKLLLCDGDLLFNRTNSPELVGKSAVYHGQQPISFASYLIRVRFSPAIADADFVNYWINSAWGRIWAQLVKTDGVSQSNINGTKLALMQLPLPPIQEQREIVRCASKLLSVAEALATRIHNAQRVVERTSQATLAKAFRGELMGRNGADDNSP